MRPKALRRPDNRRPFAPRRWFPGARLGREPEPAQAGATCDADERVGLPGPKSRRPSEIPFRYRKMSIKTGPTAPLRSGPFIRGAGDERGSGYGCPDPSDSRGGRADPREVTFGQWRGSDYRPQTRRRRECSGSPSTSRSIPFDAFNSISSDSDLPRSSSSPRVRAISPRSFRYRPRNTSPPATLALIGQRLAEPDPRV